MLTCVADLEGNALLEDVTTVHCGVFIDIRTGDIHKFTSPEPMLEFMDTCDALVFHNGYGYDFPVLKKLYGYEYKGVKHDTLLLSRMLFPQRVSPKGVRAGPHSVESWGTTFGIQKPEHEDWSKFSPEMLHRCTEDVRIQLKLYSLCIKEAKAQGWPKDCFRLTHKLFDILHEQEQMGWPVDPDKMAQAVHRLEHWVSRIDRALEPKLPQVLEKPYGETPVRKPFKQDRSLNVIASRWFDTPEQQSTVSGPFTRVQFRPVNLNSQPELKKFLLDLGWVPTEWNYKKDPVTKRPIKDEQGNFIRSSPKLNGNDEFNGISGSLGRLAAKRVQCQSRKSIIQGWIQSVRRRHDGTPTIRQRITGIADTGRLKHSGIVNVPGNEAFFGAKMREFFVADNGYVLVGTDSASCQDRMLLGRANLYGVNDPVFEDMLLNGNKEKGTDSHSRAAAAINGVFRKNKIPEITRQGAKNFNYAYKFNAQDKKLGTMANQPVRIGTAIRSALDGIFTAQVGVQEVLQKEWRQSARVFLNDWGKPEHRDGVFKGLDQRPVKVKHEKDVLVYALQSDEAILMQYALCFLVKWLQDLGWVHGKEYYFVANVHDEYQCMVRKDLVQTYIPLADRSIAHAAQYLKIQCPHKGESDQGMNWAETH